MEDKIFVISEIYRFGLKFWDGFYKYLKDNHNYNFNIDSVEELLKSLKKNKNLSLRDITIGKKVLNLLLNDPNLFDEIKALSTFEEKETIEIKFMFDKLKLISKEDWNKMIELAKQTNVFTNIELGNVKSIQLALSRNEDIKEQSLMKAFESLLKLKRFGINI